MFVSRQHHLTARRCVIFAVVAGFLLTLSPLFQWRPSIASAQNSSYSREATIKAAYIYKFTQYVRWPAQEFQTQETPLVIGVVGRNSVTQLLEAIVAKKKKVGTRLLKLRKIETDKDISGCHIIFFAGQSSPEKYRVALRDQHVFLVGENTTFLNDGGMLRFVIVQNKVRLELHLANTKSHKLSVHSQLARIADIVDPAEGHVQNSSATRTE